MTPEQFTYWLQGYSEIAGEAPTAEQWKAIQDHLALVFNKVTPDYGPAGWAPYPSDTAISVPLDFATRTLC